MVRASDLRRILASGRLYATLRQDECSLLHDWQLVRLHEYRLDRQLSGPAASRRHELTRAPVAAGRPGAPWWLRRKELEQSRRADVSGECKIRRGETPDSLVRPLAERGRERHRTGT